MGNFENGELTENNGQLSINSVCVYCSSSVEIDAVYSKDAARLGILLGQRGLRVINGGGVAGLMRVISDSAMSSGGSASGVIPRFMINNGWCNPNLTDVVPVETMHERKKTMADLSDAAIALPGGYGTLEELLEIITWQQLGLFNKPVIILNTNNYYAPLIEMFRQATNGKFIRKEQSRLWRIADKPEDVIRELFEPDN
jgi:uncharacterized protein (TIGR00730 family)